MSTVVSRPLVLGKHTLGVDLDLTKMVAAPPAMLAAQDSEVAVDGAPVRDSKRQHQELGVPDRVDHAVVTNSETPQIWIPDQRSSAGRPRIEAKGCDRSNYAPRDWFVELAQLFESSGVVLDGVRPRRGQSPRVWLTSSAVIAVLRPESRSASRSWAIRPSSWSIIAS